MKKSKNKALVVLVIALVVVLLASFAAQAFNTSGYSVSVSRIYFDTEHGTLSGLLYMPKGVSESNPAPTLVTTHGYLNSAEMQDANAIEMSRRGVVVLALDQYDHGHSRATEENSNWMAFWTNSQYDAVNYMYEQPYVLKDADGNGIIGVTGHSMGGFSSSVAVYFDELAAQAGAHVTLLEQNGRLGKKLLITGKGRCNVTNDCPWQDVLQSVPTNPRFLYSALAGFSPADAKKFFEDYGCALKTERGNRVFPVSDRSQSVLDALERFLRAYHVRILPRKAAEIAVSDGHVTGVKTAEGPVPADCVILATGGLSYPATGSTGSGYAMAQALGHTIIEPTGSLVPLVEKGHDCAKMQGLALKNIAVKLVNTKGKTVYEDFGELLFTHFGLSGPVILSASAHMARGEAGYTVRIDLKPALDEKTLDARILRDFSAAQNRDFENSLSALLPRSMIPVVIARSGIDPTQKVNSITKQQRRALLETIKCFSVPIACKAPVEDAIVTSGGVKVSEVNAKTMESKLVQGLYFAGELLDVDAYTGGFNLQIAWATGRLAGLSAAAKEFQSPEDAT